MGENATEGIYIGVYIFIFIVALSATISMFYMVNNYAELSYEYGKKVEDSSLIENVPTTSYRVVSGNQLMSYYYHYIEENTDGVYNYNIKIIDSDDREILTKKDKLTYSEILKQIKQGDNYFLSYDNVITDNNGKETINITIKKIKSENL